MTSKAAVPFQIRGWHVLVAFVAFFAVVIGIDAAMIYAAYKTFPGQTAKNPYEAGLAFNRQLLRREHERRMGWQVVAAVEPDRSLTLQVRDAAGRPLDGLKSHLRLERPATTNGAFSAPMKALGDGAYSADTRRLPPGAWDLQAVLSRDDDEIVVERRLTWR